MGQTERVAWKHVHYHVKQIASGNFLYDARSSNRANKLEGWDEVACGAGRRFKREGTYVYFRVFRQSLRRPSRVPTCKAALSAPSEEALGRVGGRSREVKDSRGT